MANQTLRSRRPPPATDDLITCEVEVIPGLEQIAIAELRSVFRRRVTIMPSLREGLLPILFQGDLSDLLDLKIPLAVYGQRRFPVPRPKALLGHEHFMTLLSMIETVRAFYPPQTFQTFRISTAGHTSAVLLRLREMIAQETGLEDVDQEGDLLIRLRRPLDGSEGWEVLLRLSPRPLSVRSWRACNLPGALNATVAQAMVHLSEPHPDDFILNLCCGSATLLIERISNTPTRIAIGCDIDPVALSCAQENVSASGDTAIRICDWDAGSLPIPDRSVDTILVDLPFGHTIGTHTTNIELYPRLLNEASRVLINGGLIVAITEDIRLWERIVMDRSEDWSIVTVQRVKIPFASGYLHPQISVLRRS